MNKLKKYWNQRKLDHAVKKLELNNSYDIFLMLKVLDIKGTPCSPYSCPISNFLKQKTKLYLFTGKVMVMGDNISCKLPDAASEFIWDFDIGRYPDLILKVK